MTEDQRGDEIVLAEFDPRRPVVRERLARRAPGGGFAVPDTDLIRAMRVADAGGERAVRDALFAILWDRCKPMFRKMAAGLAHRPEWKEDAMADMAEQLLREALDPRETFMVRNFAYYLKCLCADNFNRLLRAEGHGYRVDERGQVTGRPEHVPAVLVDSIERGGSDEEGGATVASVADTAAPLDERLASLEAQRILASVPDPLDRQIVYLRVYGQRQWDEIASICGKTERTMRTRFERARSQMRAFVISETSGTGTANGNTQLAETAPPLTRRAKPRGKGNHHA